jgi:hypothetical protein
MPQDATRMMPPHPLLLLRPTFAAECAQTGIAGRPAGEKWSMALLSIVSFVGDESGGRRAGHQDIGAIQTMRLTRLQVKSGRIAQCIDSGMEFCARPPQLCTIASASASLFCTYPMLMHTHDSRIDQGVFTIGIAASA